MPLSIGDEILFYQRYVARQPLEFHSCDESDEVERGPFPSVSAVFDPYQSQCELWDAFRCEYWTQHPRLFDEGRLQAAARARVYRTWPSLIRDHHLYLLLKQEYTTVLRCPELDEVWGIDFLVIRGPVVYGVHAYYQKDGTDWRQRKHGRHVEYEAATIHVDLPLLEDRCIRAGRVYLYSHACLEPLRRAIGTEATRRPALSTISPGGT